MHNQITVHDSVFLNLGGNSSMGLKLNWSFTMMPTGRAIRFKMDLLR